MKVKVIKANLPSYWYANNLHKIYDVEEVRLDNHKFEYKVIGSELGGTKYFDKDDVEIINEEKQMKREDKISLEMTLQEAARIYAILGRTNGDINTTLYSKLRNMLDKDGKAYKITEGQIGIVGYYTIQKELEAAIFDQKTPAQIELEALQTKISELQVQATKLQELINN